MDIWKYYDGDLKYPDIPVISKDETYSKNIQKKF